MTKPPFSLLKSLAVIFGPTVLVLILAGLKLFALVPWVAVFGGLFSGITVGVRLADRIARSEPARVLLGLLLVAVLSVACITMNFAGCLTVKGMVGV